MLQNTVRLLLKCTSNFSTMLMTDRVIRCIFSWSNIWKSNKIAILLAHFIRQLGLCIMDQKHARKQPPKSLSPLIRPEAGLLFTLVSDGIFGTWGDEWQTNLYRDTIVQQTIDASPYFNVYNSVSNVWVFSLMFCTSIQFHFADWSENILWYPTNFVSSATFMYKHIHWSKQAKEKNDLHCYTDKSKSAFWINSFIMCV